MALPGGIRCGGGRPDILPPPMCPPPTLALTATAGGVDVAVTLALGLVALALMGWLVALLRRVERRVARLEDALHRMARQEASGTAPAAAPREHGLGRVEGLLEDLRDLQRRLDDRLAALAERASAPAPVAAAAALAGAHVPEPALLVERAQNRLLALGFEQIEVVTPRDAVTPDGPLVVEARRSGAVHKGEVLLAGGTVIDVALRPAYELFP